MIGLTLYCWFLQPQVQYNCEWITNCSNWNLQRDINRHIRFSVSNTIKHIKYHKSDALALSATAVLLKGYLFIKCCYLSVLSGHRSYVIICTFSSKQYFTSATLEVQTLQSLKKVNQDLAKQISVKRGDNSARCTFSKAILEIRNSAVLQLKEILNKQNHEVNI